MGKWSTGAPMSKLMKKEFPELWIRTEWISEDQFEGMQSEWDELREEAGADPLFMSWNWQRDWWHSFGKYYGLKFRVLECRDPAGNLVGAMAMTERVLFTRGVRIRRLEILGNLMHKQGAVRSEYLEPLIKPEGRLRIARSMANFIGNYGHISELVISDSPASSESVEFLRRELRMFMWQRRTSVLENDRTEFVQLPKEWTSFLRNLGKSTRLRIFGRRRFLNERHDLKFEYASTDSLPQFLLELAALHHSRWGGRLFEGPQISFHRGICELYLELSDLRLSRLRLDGRTISVLYCLKAGGRIYNLQMGFDQNVYPGKVSPGILHLGFAIEDAIREGELEFDMLAGSGRSESYKGHIANNSNELRTLVFVRPWWLKVLYSVNDCFKTNCQK